MYMDIAVCMEMDAHSDISSTCVQQEALISYSVTHPAVHTCNYRE